MGRITIDTSRCKGCGLCVSFCPKQLIQLSKTNTNSIGYHLAEVIKPEECIGCTFCATVCPDMCIEVER